MMAEAGATGAGTPETFWIPLESNPDVMTEYSRLLGASKGTWLDVLGFDDDALSCIPQPVVALIFLYATTPQFDQDVKAEDAKIRMAGPKLDPGTYFMMQTIRNACGGIAVIHALANNTEEASVIEGPLQTLLDKTKELTPYHRGKALEQSKDIEALHQAMAVAGQTAAPNANEHVGNHFVTFVHKNGRLVELSGGRPCPIDHGPTNPEDFLKDAVGICQKRMEKVWSTAEQPRIEANTGSDTGEYRFAMFALTTAFSD